MVEHMDIDTVEERMVKERMMDERACGVAVTEYSRGDGAERNRKWAPEHSHRC